MRKRRRITVGQFLAAINLSWFALAVLLLAANNWQYRTRLRQERTIQTITAELRWRAHVQAKAATKAVQMPQLEFLARTMMTRDPGLYAIAKAAWENGPRLERWPQVRNGAALIMAVAHRESLFGSYLRSYRVKRGSDGQPQLDDAGNPVRIPLAYGPMQINYGAWKDALQLDRTRMDDPYYSVKMGTEILDRYLERNAGDISAALFDYWGGALAGGRYDYPPLVLESKYFDAIHPLAGVLQ